LDFGQFTAGQCMHNVYSCTKPKLI